MVNLVNENSEWVKGIFKLLLTEPELHDDYSFNEEYIKGQEPLKTLSELYWPMRRLIVNRNMPWSIKTMEIAYFTDVRKDLTDAYTRALNGQMITADEKSALTTANDYITSLLASIDESFAILSKDFIIEKLSKLCRMQSRAFLITQNYSSMLTLSSFTEDVDDLIIELDKSVRQHEMMYTEPGTKRKRHATPFDRSLRVEIQDIIYPTMMAPLNKMLRGGLKAQTLTGFLTKTGGGKSTVLLTIASDAVRQGQNVFFLNMEMNDYEVNNIILSSLTGRPVEEIETRLTDDSYMDELEKEYYSKVSGQFYQVAKNGLEGAVTVKELQKDVRKAERELAVITGNDDFRFDIIVIDYLYLMQPAITMSRNARSDEKYKQMVREAHDFAVNDKYAVVTVFQSNRGAEGKLRSGQQIFADDIADSYSGISDIDNMFMLASRYVDRNTGEDGCLITDVKVRKMYEGEKIHYFMRYDFEHGVYDSALAREIEIENEDDEDDEREKYKKGRQAKYDLDAVKVLECNPELKDVPISILESTLKNEKVSKYDHKYLVPFFDKRGWTPVKFKDATETMSKEEQDEMLNSWRKQILEAVERTRSMRASKIITNPEEIKITGNDLFQ